jgi:hypothetical protein
MPFILNEDKALKTALSGITVSDSGNPARPVGVWFGQPDPEIRQQSYPYITIDLINVGVAQEREHRGYVKLNYLPEGVSVDEDEEYMLEMPIPVNLDYQITTYARQPRHDRQLMYELTLSHRLPFRFGGLIVTEDNTMRRLDVLGFTKRDTTEQNKRLFRNVYTVRISSELLVHELAQVYQVTEVPNITLESSDTTFEAL